MYPTSGKQSQYRERKLAGLDGPGRVEPKSETGNRRTPYTIVQVVLFLDEQCSCVRNMKDSKVFKCLAGVTRRTRPTVRASLSVSTHAHR